MYLSDNRSITLAVSNLTTRLGVFNNKTEASSGTVLLPGMTESVLLSAGRNDWICRGLDRCRCRVSSPVESSSWGWEAARASPLPCR